MSMNDNRRGRADSFQKEKENFYQEILASVSHDLKTPLASMIGSLEVFVRMQDVLKPEKKQALIEMALQESYRLDNFISNILDMSKLENGMVRLQKERSDVEVVLKNCLLRLGHRIGEGKICIQPISGPVVVFTDAVLLTRVLYLVLDNALKYGGIPPVVTVSYGKKDEGKIGYIEVEDNGAGIEPDKLDEIFNKYTRVSRRDRQNAGTGLGLAIARASMKLLGGTITAANGKNGGAVFSVQFPIINA